MDTTDPYSHKKYKETPIIQQDWPKEDQKAESVKEDNVGKNKNKQNGLFSLTNSIEK